MKEHVLDRRRRKGIGRRGIVAAEGLDLGADDGLRGGDIIGGADGGGESDQDGGEQDKGAHEGLQHG